MMFDMYTGGWGRGDSDADLELLLSSTDSEDLVWPAGGSGCGELVAPVDCSGCEELVAPVDGSGGAKTKDPSLISFRRVAA